MRIFIVSHSSRRGGGVSVARNLISAFGRVAPRHDYFLTIPPGIGFEECCGSLPNSTCVAYRHEGRWRRWLWETRELPKLVQRFQPDIVFNMANRGLVAPPGHQVTLLQDPHLFYPFSEFGKVGLVDRATFWYHRRHLRRSLQRTGSVFCQTEVACDRVRQVYGDSADTRLCPNCFSVYARPTEEVVSPPSAIVACAAAFKLFVPTRYYPHKNLEVLPIVFERHREELKDVAVLLTISPDEDSRARKLLKRVGDLRLGDNIVSVGPLSQQELAAYYLHTDGLLLPTLLESFSGTYVEALAFGRPILTSNRDFARVVCGDSAEYFEPRDPDSIAAAIGRVRNDSEVRARMSVARAEALQRLPQSWDEIASGVVARWEELTAGPGREAEVQERT
jgi:glycosyltransferase involved in cell wall biosynthesis